MRNYSTKPLIAIYVSSHGFGHLTRVLALITGIIKISDLNIYLVSGSKQIDFARIYLSDQKHRMIYKKIQTDIGLINKENSLAIDIVRLQNELTVFVKKWESIVNLECEFLKTKDIKFIVTDISPIGSLVASTLRCDCYAISNFTWKDQYKRLEISDYIVEKFTEANEGISHYIKYPLSFGEVNKECKISNVGFISRTVDSEVVKQIKDKYNPEIFLTLGKSAVIDNVQFTNVYSTIIATEGVSLGAYNNVLKLSIETIDTHNYMAACNYVIAKAGWSTVAEALISGRKLILVERPSVYEDTFTINRLKEKNLAISITESQLKYFDFEEIKNQANIHINEEKVNKIKNDVGSILKILRI